MINLTIGKVIDDFMSNVRGHVLRAKFITPGPAVPARVFRPPHLTPIYGREHEVGQLWLGVATDGVWQADVYFSEWGMDEPDEITLRYSNEPMDFETVPVDAVIKEALAETIWQDAAMLWRKWDKRRMTDGVFMLTRNELDRINELMEERELSLRSIAERAEIKLHSFTNENVVLEYTIWGTVLNPYKQPPALVYINRETMDVVG